MSNASVAKSDELRKKNIQINLIRKSCANIKLKSYDSVFLSNLEQKKNKICENKIEMTKKYYYSCSSNRAMLLQYNDRTSSDASCMIDSGLFNSVSNLKIISIHEDTILKKKKKLHFVIMFPFAAKMQDKNFLIKM